MPVSEDIAAALDIDVRAGYLFCRWIWEQYDHMVMVQSNGRVAMRRSSAFTARIKGWPSPRIARHAIARRTETGGQAVVEAWRNLTAVARPLALTNNLISATRNGG